MFFMLTLSSVNLYQMDSGLASNLSGHYVKEVITESPSAESCPPSLQIELISTDKPDVFFLKNQARMPGSVPGKPRILPVDGQARILYTGHLARAEVVDLSSIKVHVFNKEIPSERIVETFKFESDGGLTYNTQLQDEDSVTQVQASPNAFCKNAKYKKVK